MTTTTAMQVANTIRQQLYAGGVQKVWSWGANAFRFGINETTKRAYLRFRVKGFILNGVVEVSYNEGPDTYIVELFKGNSKVAYKTIKDVYCDELTSIIDRNVETINDKSDEYKHQVDSAKFNF